jgi:hypothetical protein
LHASTDALQAVKDAADELNRALRYTGDAKTVVQVNSEAGRTLASLNEFERISGLSENPKVRAWLKVPRDDGSANVWYAEGLIAAVSEIASDEEMPDLLPPVQEISTDMRGLRDWLTSRTPDQPTAEQTELRDTINAFLKSTSWPKIEDRPVTRMELVALGKISQHLRHQVFSQPEANAPAGSAAVGAAPPKIADAGK